MTGEMPIPIAVDVTGWQVTVALSDDPDTRVTIVPPARVGDWLILAARERDGEWGPALIAQKIEDDVFYMLHSLGEGALSEHHLRRAPCPLLAPRPDMAEDAQAWIESMKDPLREAALDVLETQDPFQILDLMPPLIGPGFVRDEDPAFAPIVVEPDGSAPGLDPLPIAADQPRRYGLLWGNGPVLVIAWEGNFALLQAGGDKVYRLTFIDGLLRCEPQETSWQQDAWVFLSGIGAADLADENYSGIMLANHYLGIAMDSSMRLAALTHRGLVPRYGVGGYDRPEHHAFPPATLFLAEAELLLGHVERASAKLRAYLLRYVREDGSIDYYGPSISEYGQLLDLIARTDAMSGWGPRTGGCGLLLRALYDRVAGFQGTMGDDGLPAPRGLPEADYSDDADAHKRRYISNALWLIRGLERSRLQEREYADSSEGPGPEETWERARAMAALIVGEPDEEGFVRADLDNPEVFERMTDSREASYTNYRFWPEMLSSGLMPDAAEDAIVHWRRHHGGELLGMTRFYDRLDDWPVWHYAQSLLRLGLGRTYTMLMWAHLLHHQMPGWWVSYEQVAVAPDEIGWRRELAGQVVPCQVTVPLMLRAGLLWEDVTGEELWILPAGELFLHTLGGAAQVPEVPTAVGLAELYIELDEDGPLGKLTLHQRKDGPVTVVLPEGVEVVRAYVEGYGGPAALADLEGGDPEVDMASVLDDAEFVAEFPDPSEEYVERVGSARFRQEGRRVVIEAETQHEERLALEFGAGPQLRIDE